MTTHRAPDGSATTALYARIYLDPAVTPDADLAAVQTGGAIADPTLAGHVAAIQAALQISAADALTLFAPHRRHPHARQPQHCSTASPPWPAARAAPAGRSASRRAADKRRLPGRGAHQPGLDARLHPARCSPSASPASRVDALVHVLTTAADGTPGSPTTRSRPSCCRPSGPRCSRRTTRSSPAPTRRSRSSSASSPSSPPSPIPQCWRPPCRSSMTPIAGTDASRNGFIASTLGVFMDVATAQADLAPLPGRADRGAGPGRDRPAGARRCWSRSPRSSPRPGWSPPWRRASSCRPT